jgi:hypothetical protein
MTMDNQPHLYRINNEQQNSPEVQQLLSQIGDVRISL